MLGLGPVLDSESLYPAKGVIVGHEECLGGERLGSDHEVEVAHGLATFFERGANAGVVLSRGRIPNEHFDASQKFLNHDSKLLRLRQFGYAEAQLGFGDYGNSNLADRDFREPLSDVRKGSFDDVAYGVGIEKVADEHLEKPAFLRRGVFAICKKVFREVDRAHQFEEIAPRIRTAGQDDVASRGIAPNVDLRACKAVFGGQADGLATAVAEELGSLCL